MVSHVAPPPSPASCVVGSSRALSGCVALATHKELKDLTLDTVRMLLLDDGANPCETPTHPHTLTPSHSNDHPWDNDNPPSHPHTLTLLQGPWRPVTCSSQPLLPRALRARHCARVQAHLRRSPSLSGGEAAMATLPAPACLPCHRSCFDLPLYSDPPLALISLCTLTPSCFDLPLCI